jgi:hypothetical protein
MCRLDKRCHHQIELGRGTGIRQTAVYQIVRRPVDPDHQSMVFFEQRAICDPVNTDDATSDHRGGVEHHDLPPVSGMQRFRPILIA